MSNASAAITSARVYLNDSNSISWNDAVLMPILREAFGELQLALGIHRLPVIKAETAPITVSIGVNVLPNTPDNITAPISMFERAIGEDDDDWEEMEQVTFLPEELPDEDLIYWSWQAQQIKFIGATTDRQVILRYEGYLTPPSILTDPLGFIQAERFLGPRIAAIALAAVNQEKRAATANMVAQENLYQIVQYNVTADQRPVRRRKYRDAKNTTPGGATRIGLP